MSVQMPQSSESSPALIAPPHNPSLAPTDPSGDPPAARPTSKPPRYTKRLSPATEETVQFQEEDFFGYQPTSSSELPHPRVLLCNLSRCAIEVKAGVRDIDQLARWVTDEAYRSLLTRMVIADRARAKRGERPVRPIFTVRISRLYAPRDGVVEAVLMAHHRDARPHAVAVRLEGLDGRWRASALHVM